MPGMMSRGRIISVLLAIAFIVVLIAVFESCRSGTQPPAERDRLDETSYRAEANSSDQVAVGFSDEIVRLDFEQL